MRKPTKITDEEILDHYSGNQEKGIERKAPSEIAELFKISRMTLWRRLKRIQRDKGIELSAPVAKEQKIRKKLTLTKIIKVTQNPIAKKSLEKNINAIEQLQRINDRANEILDAVTGDQKFIDRVTEAINRLLGEDNPKEKNKILNDLIVIITQDHLTALKACAEIRGQLILQLELFKTLYSLEGIQEFQKIVLDAINRCSPDLRTQILEEIKRVRVLRFEPPKGKPI